MKTLISERIIEKFLDTIAEETYESQWKKFSKWQKDNIKLIETVNETGYQDAFMQAIFQDILGYSSSSNLTSFDYKREVNVNGKKVDAVLYKNKEPFAVVELKDTNTNDLLKTKKDMSANLHSLAPIHQASIYHFMIPTTEYGIVSNFRKILLFKNKQDFRQEYDLFSMDYNTFKEFYLIFSKESFFGNLTSLMISQMTVDNKVIDDDFFTKLRSLYKILKNNNKDKDISNMFIKFLAILILEDSGRIKPNIVKMINQRELDFLSSGKLQDIWNIFFNVLKSSSKADEKKRNELGFDNSLKKIWKLKTDDIHLSKNLFPLLDELSEYDLYSIKLDELFYLISETIDGDESFNYLYSEDNLKYDTPFKMLEDIFADAPFYAYKMISEVESGAFVNKVFKEQTPLIKLYNILSTDEIEINSKEPRILLSPRIYDTLRIRESYVLVVNAYASDTVDLVFKVNDIMQSVNGDNKRIKYINFEDYFGQTLVFILVASEEEDLSGITPIIRYFDTEGHIKYTREIDIDRIKYVTYAPDKYLDLFLTNEKEDVIGELKLSDILIPVEKEEAKIRLIDGFGGYRFEEYDTDLEDYPTELEEDEDVLYLTVVNDYEYIIKSNLIKDFLLFNGLDLSTVLSLVVPPIFLSKSFKKQTLKRLELEDKLIKIENKLNTATDDVREKFLRKKEELELLLEEFEF